MKSSVVLDVSAEEYYECFLQNIAMDYVQNCRSKISLQQIKAGFSYSKTVTGLGTGKADAQVTIVEANRPAYYEIHYKSDKSERISACEIERLDDFKIRLTLTETVLSKSEMQGSMDAMLWQNSGKAKGVSLIQRIQYKFLEKAIVRERGSGTPLEEK